MVARADSRAAVLGVLVALGLVACGDKQPKTPPRVPVEQAVVVPNASVGAVPATAPAASSTSVPEAASVLGSSTPSKPELPQGRTNKTMTRAEESTAMPLPGQNNDHSAPVPPAKRASGS